MLKGVAAFPEDQNWVSGPLWAPGTHVHRPARRENTNKTPLHIHTLSLLCECMMCVGVCVRTHMWRADDNLVQLVFTFYLSTGPRPPDLCIKYLTPPASSLSFLESVF